MLTFLLAIISVLLLFVADRLYDHSLSLFLVDLAVRAVRFSLKAFPYVFGAACVIARFATGDQDIKNVAILGLGILVASYAIRWQIQYGNRLDQAQKVRQRPPICKGRIS